MTATTSVEHGTARALRRLLDFDPDSGSATLATLDPAAAATCVAIAQFRRFLFGVVHTVGTGQITSASIIAATSAAGAGNTAVVTKTTVPITADAVGDTFWIECDAEQIHEVLAAATHVGLSLTLQTSTDECIVSMEFEPMFPRTGLTADYIS